MAAGRRITRGQTVMVLSFLIVGCSCRKDDIPRVTYPESYEFQEPDHVFQVPDASSQVSQPANIAIETSVKAGQRVAFHGAVIPAPGEEDPGGVFVFIYDTTPDRERVNAHVEAAEAQNENLLIA